VRAATHPAAGDYGGEGAHNQGERASASPGQGSWRPLGSHKNGFLLASGAQGRGVAPAGWAVPAGIPIGNH